MGEERCGFPQYFAFLPSPLSSPFPSFLPSSMAIRGTKRAPRSAPLRLRLRAPQPLTCSPGKERRTENRTRRSSNRVERNILGDISVIFGLIARGISFGARFLSNRASNRWPHYFVSYQCHEGTAEEAGVSSAIPCIPTVFYRLRKTKPKVGNGLLVCR